MRKLSIVIPCYNERDTVCELLQRVSAVALPADWEKEVIVVDDASTDGTRELLKTCESPFTLVLSEKNYGKGSALALGFAAATGDYCLIQDADLEYDPNDIPALLSALEDNVTVVYGSRNLPNLPRKGAVLARIGVWFLTMLINTLYALRLTDVWTCYKLFSREDTPLWRAGRFESELLFTAALARKGRCFTEVPISYFPRDVVHGKKIRYRDGLAAIWFLLSDYITHRLFLSR